jgi:hypothetical protein
MRAHGSPAAPTSPLAATTVTSWASSSSSAAFSSSSWARSTQCSPPICPAGLREMMPPSEAPSRRAATDAATAFDQEDGERCARCYRVDDFGVQDLLPKGEPGVRGVGDGAHHLEARRRQVEQAVEGGEVLAQIGHSWWGELRLGQLGQHYGLAPAVDAARKERLDAVGDLELRRCVAGGHRRAVGGPARGLCL